MAAFLRRSFVLHLTDNALKIIGLRDMCVYIHIKIYLCRSTLVISACF